MCCIWVWQLLDIADLCDSNGSFRPVGYDRYLVGLLSLGRRPVLPCFCLIWTMKYSITDSVEDRLGVASVKRVISLYKHGIPILHLHFKTVTIIFGLIFQSICIYYSDPVEGVLLGVLLQFQINLNVI